MRVLLLHLVLESHVITVKDFCYSHEEQKISTFPSIVRARGAIGHWIVDLPAPNRLIIKRFSGAGKLMWSKSIDPTSSSIIITPYRVVYYPMWDGDINTIPVSDNNILHVHVSPRETRNLHPSMQKEFQKFCHQISEIDDLVSQLVSLRKFIRNNDFYDDTVEFTINEFVKDNLSL